MVFSQRELEGYVRIDHRESPGFSDNEILASGMPFARKNTLFEGATLSCGHCRAIVIKNPGRDRERAHCHGCDHYICDNCEAERVLKNKPCKPFKQVFDEFIDKASKGLI